MSQDKKPVDIGGQAVMEGVMMKAPDAIAVSVRRPNGKIVIKHANYTPVSKKHKWMGWPFIRGIVSMGLMLGQGMKTLQQSTDMLGVMEEEPTKFEIWLSKKLGKGIDKIVMGVAIVLAIVLALGLFFMLPQAIGSWIRTGIENKFVVNLLEGLVRITILIGYMIFCGMVPDVRRTFQYHGAEHKTVYCNENKKPLTPKNADEYSCLHPRCGTSFLLIVFVLAFIVYTVFAYNGPEYILRLLSRLALLPLVAGISYEVLKGLAHKDNVWVRALRWPGMQLQRLTTKKPDLKMLEIAICSMNVALYGIPKHLTPDKDGYVYVDSYEETHPDYVPPVKKEEANEDENDCDLT
jgi:Predicted metal-dependent enzyme